MEHQYWLDPIIAFAFQYRLPIALILTTLGFLILAIEADRRGL